MITQIDRPTSDPMPEMPRAQVNGEAPRAWYSQQRVPISSLTVTQPYVDADRVEGMMQDGIPEKPVDVIPHRGQLFVEDGHNRIEATTCCGGEDIDINLKFMSPVEAEKRCAGLSAIGAIGLRAVMPESQE